MNEINYIIYSNSKSIKTGYIYVTYLQRFDNPEEAKQYFQKLCTHYEGKNMRKIEGKMAFDVAKDYKETTFYLQKQITRSKR